MRAKALGYQCLMIEDSFVYHQGSASFKKVTEQKDLIKKNKKIFLKKNPEADLRHLRQDNLLTIKNYLTSSDINRSNKGVIRVLEHRIKSLYHELPKSLFKKCLWRIKIYSVKIQLKKNGFDITI
jgi:GT2 family glycosyltransferase